VRQVRPTDLWPACCASSLGAHAPQTKLHQPLDASERIAIADCLANLEMQWRRAGNESEAKIEAIAEPAPPAKPHRNLLQRVMDYFI